MGCFSFPLKEKLNMKKEINFLLKVRSFHLTMCGALIVAL